MERSGDTRTIAAPIVMYELPWDLDFGFKFGADYGNYNQLTTGANATFYQYSDNLDSGYYVQGRFSYTSKDWETARILGGGTVRGDFGLYDFSDDLKLSLAAFGAVLHDSAIDLDLRATGGGGLWLNYSSEHIINGFSIFSVDEYERFNGGSWEFAPRLSVRNMTVVPLGDHCSFTLDAFYTPNFNDFGDFRTSVAGTFDVAINSNFSLNVSGLYEYDSRPQDGVNSHDVTTTVGLNVSFGAEEDDTAISDNGDK